MLYYYRIIKFKVLSYLFKHDKGDVEMGTIVCQECEATLGYFEDEKVTVLYSSNCNCSKHKQNKEDK